mgnify:FL=1
MHFKTFQVYSSLRGLLKDTNIQTDFKTFQVYSSSDEAKLKAMINRFQNFSSL